MEREKERAVMRKKVQMTPDMMAMVWRVSSVVLGLSLLSIPVLFCSGVCVCVCVCGGGGGGGGGEGGIDINYSSMQNA